MDMRRFAFLPVLLLVSAMMQSAVAAEMREEFLQDYCMDCHNIDDFSGGLAFDLMPLDVVRGHEETWEKVLTKAGVGMMPPPGENQPDPGRLAQFLGDIESDLSDTAINHPNPVPPALHRLNAREYQNAIRDLLQLPFNALELLPADDSIEGFDNIAEGLVVSPALIQAYVSVAGKISRLAVGDPSIASSISEYQAPRGSQDMRLDGMPLGTRGGIVVEHVFPLDGDYEISVRRSGPSTGMRNPVGTHDRIEILLDGERLEVFEPGQAGKITIPVKAGAHTLAATFISRQKGAGVTNTYSPFDASTRVTSLSVNGPVASRGAGDTASRRRIFTCFPRELAEESPCARQILETLATRAFRQPVTEAAMAVYMAFYDEGREMDFDTGIQYALARILVDPKFIYRFEEEPSGLEPGTIYRIDEFDLASRLSFFLWSSIPDDELLLLAKEGRLSDPAVLEGQVSRMLDDPKANAMVSNFVPQWLSLQLLESATPQAEAFDDGLRQAMRRETELFAAEILRGNRSILEFLEADFTYVNERLARHYDLPNIRGDHFRRVTLADSPRAGLMGQASILTGTSAPNRTSPVMRGKWILETLLGAPPPEPPPGVEADIDVSVPAAGGEMLSVRQRLEMHRENPSCAACHNMIDPLGFALENYDLTGRWREASAGTQVDASARLWDGTEITGSAGLRHALLERKRLFVETFTEKLMTYALGRVLTYSDMPRVREIVADASADDYRFASIVKGIVESDAFQYRIKVAEPVQVAQH